MKPFVYLIASLFILSACSPVNINLQHLPRACTEADNRPAIRAGYPNPWARDFDPGTAGYDLMFRYLPQERRAGQRIVHQANWDDRSFDFNPATGECDVENNPPPDRFTELMHTPSNDVQWWFFTPSQSWRFRHAIGSVAVVEAPSGHPFPAINNNEEAVDLLPWWNALPQGVRNDLIDEINDGIFAQYDYQYQFDNCHTPPRTDCGQRHCVILSWFDVEGGQRTRSRTTVTYGSDGTNLCPMMTR